jgi:hypothetical protein
MPDEKTENTNETELPTDTNQYVIGGVTYNVTSSFRNEIDLQKTVYEHAMERVLEKMRESEK